MDVKKRKLETDDIVVSVTNACIDGALGETHIYFKTRFFFQLNLRTSLLFVSFSNFFTCSFEWCTVGQKI